MFPYGVHFGSEKTGIWLEKVSFNCYCDTLYSAICQEILKLYGEDEILKFYQETVKGNFLFSDLLPYQNTSVYETVLGNLYDYEKQISILRAKPEIVIAPAKVLTEKFPTANFFEENCLKLKIGDSIAQKDLLEKLLVLGYKRATMVSDIGEFSIRGDIADIYSLSENPIRIEFWGDEIVDIRYFNNETQKSIEKVNEIQILPIYKFILPKNTPEEFSPQLKEQFNQEGYF